MFSTFIVLVCLAVPVEPNPLWPEFSMKCSQEELCIGDTLYISLHAHNPHEKSLFLGDVSPLSIDRCSLRFNLVEPGFPLLYQVFGGFSDLNAVPPHIMGINEIKPNENRDIGFHAFQIPPLEDLHDPNWKEFVKDIPPEGKKLTLEVTINAVVAKDRFGGIAEFEGNRVMTREFLIKPRPSGETTLIEKWFQEMPEMFYPRVSKRPPIKICGWGFMEDKAFDEQTPEEERKKLIMAFHQTGNRYPTYPNAPITWQGWKELEESLTPSTMRDEIRLTRILIQYCNTKDIKVLDELKEWFADMNEVQRVCMAKSIWDRVKGSIDKPVLYESFCELYKTIREYDIAAKTENEIAWLKQLELLE